MLLALFLSGMCERKTRTILCFRMYSLFRIVIQYKTLLYVRHKLPLFFIYLSCFFFGKKKKASPPKVHERCCIVTPYLYVIMYCILFFFYQFDASWLQFLHSVLWKNSVWASLGKTLSYVPWDTLHLYLKLFWQGGTVWFCTFYISTTLVWLVLRISRHFICFIKQRNKMC